MKTCVNNNGSRSGIALVLVMMTIIVLSVIVGSLALSMTTEMRLARNTEYDAQMEWMGRSGIEVARYAMANKCPDQKGIDALDQYWAGGTTPCSNGVENFPLKNIQLGGGHIDITITDMERKWDINQVANPRSPQREILQKALAEAGVTDEEQSSTIIDSILDWINPSSTSGFSGAKSDYYMGLNPPYYCKNGNIDDMSELLLIKGVTPEIYWGSRSTNHPVSAFQQHGGGAFGSSTPTVRSTGAGFNSDQNTPTVGLVDLFAYMGNKLNINTAPIETLQLIPGIDESIAARILQGRQGPDGQDGTDDDVPLQNPGELSEFLGQGGATGALATYVDVRSYVFMVKVDAHIDDYHRIFYGIISRGQGGGGQQLQCIKFYWE